MQREEVVVMLSESDKTDLPSRAQRGKDVDEG